MDKFESVLRRCLELCTDDQLSEFAQEAITMLARRSPDAYRATIDIINGAECEDTKNAQNDTQTTISLNQYLAYTYGDMSAELPVVGDRLVFCPTHADETYWEVAGINNEEQVINLIQLTKEVYFGKPVFIKANTLSGMGFGSYILGVNGKYIKTIES